MGGFKPLTAIIAEYEENLCILRVRRAEVEQELCITPGNELRLKLAHRRALLSRMIFEGECAVRLMQRDGP